MNRSCSWVTEYVALLVGTRLKIPSSGRGLKFGGFTGYAHAGGASALSVGAEEEKDANESARIAVNIDLMLFPFSYPLGVPSVPLVERILHQQKNIHLSRFSLCTHE
jgi:hypothetical protein